MVKRKKILILSYYYYPDLCAGSFRCASFVEQLQAFNKDEYQIDIITTMPNRYASFSTEAVAEEEIKPSLRIKRIRLPPHKSALIDQSRGFLHFAKEAIKDAKTEDYALVFATSSRLMTAVLGAYIARKKKAKLYLDIRDIFLDTLNDAFPKPMKYACKPFFSCMERWTFNKANRINLVSKGFLSYFEDRYRNINDFDFYPNGIDKEFLKFRSSEQSQHSYHKPYKVLYAGNIGEGQGLHLIIPDLAKKLGDTVQFRIIGDGGRRSQLEKAIDGLDNIEVLPPVSRETLLIEYEQADVVFLHLNDYPAFLKVLPSKIFEYVATGKPILAGVGGFCAEFIKQEIANAQLFSPCQPNEAYEAFFKLEFKSSNRAKFIEEYSRDKIMQSMAMKVLKCADGEKV